MAKKWRKMVALVKPEAAYGTDSTPTGASNAVLMSGVTFRPMEGTDVPRDFITPWLGNQGSLVGDVHGVLVGSTELAGSGAPGVAPHWGAMARACGLSQTIVTDTSVTYEPVSNSEESASIYFYMDGIRHILKGGRGTGVLRMPAGGIPRIEWTLTGLWTQPTDTANASPTFTAARALLVNKTNTQFEVDEAALVMRSLELNLGLDVQPRMLVNAESIEIADKAEQLSLTIEATALSVFNPFAKALARTPVAIECVHGVTAGNIVTLNLPIVELDRPPAAVNQQGIAEWPLTGRPLPSAGDDQFSIVLT